MKCLVKTEQERVLFFCEQGRGLCYRREEDAGVSVLCDRCQGEFDVLAGEELQVACQDDAGNLYFYTQRSGQWRRRLVLSSKREEPAASCLRLWEGEESHFLFYLLESRGERLLICHPLEEGRPRALAKVEGANYLLRADPAGCLSLVYDQGGAMLRRYRYGSWGEPVLLGDFHVEDALFERPDAAHFAVSRGGSLFYLWWQEGQVRERLPVTRSGQLCPVLLQYEESVFVLYEERGRVFYWKKGERAPAAVIAGGEPELFHLRFSHGGEAGLARCAYGNRLRGRVNLFLVGRLPETKKPVFSDSGVIELTKLRLRLEALEQRMKRLESLEKAQRMPVPPKDDRE